MGKGFMRLIIRCGVMESPDIPAVSGLCKHQGERSDMMETSFYLSRETIVPPMTRRMALLRARPFRGLEEGHGTLAGLIAGGVVLAFTR